MDKARESLNNIWGWIDGDAAEKCDEDFDIVEKALDKANKNEKILEALKGLDLDIEYHEDRDEWTLLITVYSQDCDMRFPVYFGEGKERYDAIKEWLENGRD